MVAEPVVKLEPASPTRVVASVSGVKQPYTWSSKLAKDIDLSEEAEMSRLERGDDDLTHLESRGDDFGTQSRTKRQKHANCFSPPSSNTIEVGMSSSGESPLKMADSQEVYEMK